MKKRKKMKFKCRHCDEVFAGVKDRREHERLTHKVTAHSKKNGTSIHYCPGCGCNLDVVALAMRMAGKLK